jgi:hypothetical protein
VSGLWQNLSHRLEILSATSKPNECSAQTTALEFLYLIHNKTHTAIAGFAKPTFLCDLVP